MNPLRQSEEGRHSYGGYDWRKRNDLSLDGKAELESAMNAEWSSVLLLRVMLEAVDQRYEGTKCVICCFEVGSGWRVRKGEAGGPGWVMWLEVE